MTFTIKIGPLLKARKCQVLQRVNLYEKENIVERTWKKNFSCEEIRSN